MRSEPQQTPAISEITRRNIFDAITLSKGSWSGRMPEEDFLARIYDLATMPSYDQRHKDAAGDIYRHRVMNNDWPDDWVFTDTRFNLMRCPDEELLRFLAEMLHPVVRPDAAEVEGLQASINEHLARDGWELYPATSISGYPVFAARRRIGRADHAVNAIKSAVEPLDAEYLTRQITRMNAALESDPELAIGTAKELLETVCKAILVARTGSYDPALELPALIKATTKQLRLAPGDVPAAAKGAETIRVLLSNLASIAGRLAELRNLYGTGHGKAPATRGLDGRHARLAAGAAATLATFLMETHFEKQDRRGAGASPAAPSNK
jgi:hypothetical protein